MAARKNKTCLTLPFLALFALNAYADEAIALKLHNHLAACIKISKPTMYTAEGILFAKISYVQKESVAACGCKSLDSDFIASGGKNGSIAFLMKGNIMFGKAGTMNLPLNMNQLPIPVKTINLNISCAEQG